MLERGNFLNRNENIGLDNFLDNSSQIIHIVKWGMLKNGKLTGSGKIIHPNRMIETGLFVDDIIQKGEILMPSGVKIVGFFDRGSIIRGKILSTDGSQVIGWNFKDNQLLDGIKIDKNGFKAYFLHGVQVSQEKWNQIKESYTGKDLVSKVDEVD